MAGGAWHAGALAAIEELGWDPRDADLIVGTSAGAGTAATLRLGLPASDLLATAIGAEPSGIGREYLRRAGGAMRVPPPEPIANRRPAAPGLVLRAALRPGSIRATTALAGLLPAGPVPTTFVGERIRANDAGRWPERATWICAVRMDEGGLVVFGRDRDDIALATAVEASSAVPGRFSPVVHDGVSYFDGAVHSPTNADLAAGLGFDLVIVSSPMSGTRSVLSRSRIPGSRHLHASTLAREVRALRASGTPVLVLQPDEASVDAIGTDNMDVTSRRRVASAAHASVRAYLRTPTAADRIALLG